MSDQPLNPPQAVAHPLSLAGLGRGAFEVLPGLALCAGVTAAAYGFEAGEVHLFGRAWLEALVLAILVGTAVRTAWTPGTAFRAGIDFGAKQTLELAVALLGVSISFRTLAEVGPGLLFGIAGVVLLAIPTSFGICRLLGLPRRMAVLVACGNSICGNSAIAAVAPTIGADGDDVAASIAFTAVLGVLVVLGLPVFGAALGLSQLRFGALAGLTVYAVPQVLAAASPVGPTAVQIGTLVKLVRVLMLGPVVLILSMLAGRLRDEPDEPAPHVRDLTKGSASFRQDRRGGAPAEALSFVGPVAAGARPKAGHVAVHRMVPPFILAFLAFATLRSAGLVPAAALAPTATVANVLTILSMAALGLGVDVRMVARAGLRVTGAVALSLAALGAMSLGLIHALGLA